LRIFIKGRIVKILAIAGHADDIELGAGGSMAKHAAAGDEIVLLLITHSGYSDYNGKLIRSKETANREAQSAAKILGIKEVRCLGYETKEVSYAVDLIEDINRVVDEIRPDLIYTHWYGDPNQDHSAISRATLIAARNIDKILMYRSNWHESIETFKGKYKIDITGHIQTKIKAVSAHKSEIKKRGPTWVEYFKNYNRNCGIEAGVEFAEIFEIAKWVEK
jgi:LmbE family N-acetylglucosaminyl deacetylase